MSSPALVKNCSELNGCTKTLTFEKSRCSRASPESPLDAWKALKVKLRRRAFVRPSAPDALPPHLPLLPQQVGLGLLNETRNREKARGWSPRLLGGLAGGRVRSRNRRGIPKKKSCSLKHRPGSKSNTATGEIEFNMLVKNWCKLFTKLKISQNL